MVLDNIALISANGFSAFAVVLMLYVIKNQRNFDKRLQHVENDLYVDNANPTSMPLTKQVFNLSERVSNIKNEISKLNKNLVKIESTMATLNNMVTDLCNEKK